MEITNVYQLQQALESATTHISFWGARVVTMKGYGSTTVDQLASKVRQFANKKEFSLEERKAGVKATMKIQKLYTDTDTQITKRNCFTRLINWIREFSFVPYGDPRFYINDPFFTVFTHKELDEKHPSIKNRDSIGDSTNLDPHVVLSM